MLLQDLRADVRASLRGLAHQRLASFGAGAALALGIAGSVTAAAVAYGGLLRPLPFADAARLLTVTRVVTPSNIEAGLSAADFETSRRRLESAGSLVGLSTETTVIRGTTAPTEARTDYVVGSFFQTFGVPAEAGRILTDADPAGAVVVSHRFAVRTAGSPGAAVGRGIDADGHTLTVVGVMPASFSVLDSHVDLWMNGRDAPPLTFFGGPDRRSYSLVARLAPGVTVSAFAARAQDALRALVPDKQAGNWQVHVGSLRDRLAGNARTTLVIFFIASFLILLVASANAAMLFVNGVMARRSDLAVRMALGASRARVIRVELLQTACLTAAATTAGWGLALAAVRVVGSLAGLDLPALATRATTGPVTAGAILAAAFVGVVCGTVQVAAIRDARLATALRSSRSSAGRGSRRLRGALVIVQMATATVLLTGTGLLGRTLLVLAGTDVGLDGTDRVLTLSVPLSDSATARDDAARMVLAGRLVDEARALPGVMSAGMGGALPPATAQLAFTVRYVTDTEDRTTRFDVVSASDGYLEALGARLVRGRLFEPRDEQGGGFVAVVSESALRHLGLSFDDLDKPLNMALPSASGERIKPRLVGVVGDIRYTGLDAPTTGSLYVLSRQIPLNRAYLLVRTSRDVRTIAPEVSRLVRRADPSLPIGTSESLGAAIDRTLSSRSARFALVAVFAGTAVLLVLAGLSAALVRSVAERERELAIRAAVGATPERLLRSVLTRGLMLAGVGAGIGVLGALAGARFVASAVYGVTPYDPPTYAAAVACIVTVALIAAWLPARRAARADPVALLRSE